MILRQLLECAGPPGRIRRGALDAALEAGAC